jgi:hypothetical protein
MVQKIDLMDRLKQRHISTPEEYEEVSSENTVCLRRYTNSVAQGLRSPNESLRGQELQTCRRCSLPGTWNILPEGHQ